MILLSSLFSFDPGIIIWTTLIFLISWGLLGKVAWKPLIKALGDREHKIADSLHQAEKAREEMAALEADHQKLLDDAKETRARIIREAKDIKEEMITSAKDDAKKEARKIVEDAKLEIYNQKMAAITEVKNLIGTSVINLSKDVLSRDLSRQGEQEAFIAQEVSKIKLN